MRCRRRGDEGGGPGDRYSPRTPHLFLWVGTRCREYLSFTDLFVQAASGPPSSRAACVTCRWPCVLAETSTPVCRLSCNVVRPKPWLCSSRKWSVIRTRYQP